VPGLLRVFDPEQDFRAEGGPSNGGGYSSPAEWSGDRVSEAAAEGEIDGDGDDVGERFEEQVGMDGIGAEVEIDREGCGLG
jgi:hypothetical protein